MQVSAKISKVGIPASFSNSIEFYFEFYLEIREIAKALAAAFETSTLLKDADNVNDSVKAIIIV